MAEVTRVPLQPIAKGSLAKMWLGVLVALLLAAGVAWATVPKGVSVEVIEPGVGNTLAEGDVAFVKYKGMLDDGTVFDEWQPAPIPPGVFPEGSPFPVEEGATVQGFYEGMQQMKKGGKYLLEIPGDKAYGAEPPPGSEIPANADLTFEVEVVDVMSQDDFQRRLQALQQMMQQQMQQGGGEGGAPAGPPTDQPQQ